MWSRVLFIYDLRFNLSTDASVRVFKRRWERFDQSYCLLVLERDHVEGGNGMIWGGIKGRYENKPLP